MFYEPSGMQDMHQTPYARGFLQIPSRLMSGPEVHANLVESLLTGRQAVRAQEPHPYFRSGLILHGEG